MDVAGAAFERLQEEGVEIHAATLESASRAEGFTPNEGLNVRFRQVPAGTRSNRGQTRVPPIA
jgi:hypothetical protein